MQTAAELAGALRIAARGGGVNKRFTAQQSVRQATLIQGSSDEIRGLPNPKEEARRTPIRRAQASTSTLFRFRGM